MVRGGCSGLVLDHILFPGRKCCPVRKGHGYARRAPYIVISNLSTIIGRLTRDGVSKRTERDGLGYGCRTAKRCDGDPRPPIDARCGLKGHPINAKGVYVIVLCEIRNVDLSFKNSRWILTNKWNDGVQVRLVCSRSIVNNVRPYAYTQNIVEICKKIGTDCVDSTLCKLETPVGRCGDVCTRPLFRKGVQPDFIRSCTGDRNSSSVCAGCVRSPETEKKRTTNPEFPET